MAKPELRDHRKFLKLKRLLGAPTPHVLGYLDCLWHRGYQTGNPFIGDALDVEAAAEFPGEPGTFAEAAHQAGFLDKEDDGYSIHDLFHHAPEYAKKRMRRRGTAPKVCRAATEMPKTLPRGNENGENVSARHTEPIAKNQEPRTDSQEPRTKNQEQANTEAGDERKNKIRFNPESGEWEGITDKNRAVWAKAFPAVDLDADLAKAAAWCVANPTKAPKSNYARFLTNWFSRTQDRGGNRGRDSPSKNTESAFDRVSKRFLAGEPLL